MSDFKNVSDSVIKNMIRSHLESVVVQFMLNNPEGAREMTNRATERFTKEIGKAPAFGFDHYDVADGYVCDLIENEWDWVLDIMEEGQGHFKFEAKLVWSDDPEEYEYDYRFTSV